MDLPKCKNCDHESNAKDGVCSVKKASDGLPIRCVGAWSEAKHYYLKKYIETFTTSMRKKWYGQLYYIDLFTGPGKCMARETEKEIDGSPLIALNAPYPFARYFFVDLNKEVLNILSGRCKNHPDYNRIKLINGDCNSVIDEIICEIPIRSLSLAFVDPTGLDFKFSTLQKLAKRKVDLIITFPEGMAIKRNIKKFLNEVHSPLDDVIGYNGWRQFNTGREIIEYYRDNLTSLGYQEVKLGEEIQIRSISKNLPLYFLLFASKHPLGHQFWQDISKIEHTGQRRFDFNGFPNHNFDVVTNNKAKVKYKKYYRLNGKTKTLFAQVNDGSIITRFDKTPLPQKATDVICPHFIELKWAYGCPFDCSWCYLKGTFRFRPEGIKPVIKDLEKVKLHVQTFLDEVKEPEILNTGELADSLMMENGSNAFSKFIIPLFESQNKHKVLFVTKSNNVKNLLQINPHNQVIVSFTLNALPVVELWEKKAPKVLDRIKAAEELHNTGYEVRIRIDPMVPIENWEKYYQELVDRVFSRFTPERITLGSLRGLQSTINGTSDRSWVHYLKETSNWGKKIDFTTRLKMYLNIINYLKKEHSYNNIALCKETKAMWQKLGMNYKNIRCNCIW